MTAATRSTAVRCRCGNLSAGDLYPYRDRPQAQHAEHCLVTHASEHPEHWLASPYQTPAWARGGLAARLEPVS